MTVEKTGLEYIEVGDLIRIDYPTITPVGKYMVLQIHHEIGKLPTYTLGKYTGGLDHKLAELINAGRKVSAEIRGESFLEEVEIIGIVKDMAIKELEIEIREIMTSSTSQTLGFNLQLGFNTSLGFLSSSSSSNVVLYRKDLA